MKGKQRAEQHDLHSVFLDKNKQTKKNPWKQNSREPRPLRARQQPANVQMTGKWTKHVPCKQVTLHISTWN